MKMNMFLNILKLLIGCKNLDRNLLMCKRQLLRFLSLHLISKYMESNMFLKQASEKINTLLVDLNNFFTLNRHHANSGHPKYYAMTFQLSKSKIFLI